MPKEKITLPLPVIAEKLGIGHYHRHVFLCVGPDCCAPEVGLAAWEVLKKLLKERGLSLSTGPNACYRTKVQCLRICTQGPILVVYPGGMGSRHAGRPHPAFRARAPDGRKSHRRLDFRGEPAAESERELDSQ